MFRRNEPDAPKFMFEYVQLFFSFDNNNDFEVQNGMKRKWPKRQQRPQQRRHIRAIAFTKEKYNKGEIIRSSMHRSKQIYSFVWANKNILRCTRMTPKLFSCLTAFWFFFFCPVFVMVVMHPSSDSVYAQWTCGFLTFICPRSKHRWPRCSSDLQARRIIIISPSCCLATRHSPAIDQLDVEWNMHIN